MPIERLSVVVTRRLPEPVEARLQELFDTKLSPDDAPMSREAIVAAMKEADVVVPTITDRIDAGMLGQAGDRLKLIANYGAGVDHIDVHTARQRGILVSNTPGVLTVGADPCHFASHPRGAFCDARRGLGGLGSDGASRGARGGA